MHLPRLALVLPTLLASLFLGALGAALPDVPWLGAGTARAEPPVIYKWVDEHGIAHYTTDRNRIPAAIRDRVVQSDDTARHRDWLQRDSGDADPSAPAAVATPSARQRAEDVEVPEDSDGVHAVASEPDWSQAPGGEAEWAADELGEEGEVAGRSVRGSEPQPALESAPVPAAQPPAQPAPRAAAPRVAPPPPPPPLEADGAPVAEPTRVVPDDGMDPSSARGAESFDGGSELPFDEPPAPATVAAPAPPALAPDARAKLDELDREIAGIEEEISRDEETLMVILSETEGVEENSLVDDPRFRDVAQRLPRLQADLERLRERRARIQPRVTPQ